MVTEAVFQTSLSEVEQVLNGCALTANLDDPHVRYHPFSPPRSLGRADRFYRRKWRQVQFLAYLPENDYEEL